MMEKIRIGQIGICHEHASKIQAAVGLLDYSGRKVCGLRLGITTKITQVSLRRRPPFSDHLPHVSQPA